jgi:D-serine deaminase-like pyridoxal phosphate-dependent protein
MGVAVIGVIHPRLKCNISVLSRVATKLTRRADFGDVHANAVIACSIATQGASSIDRYEPIAARPNHKVAAPDITRAPIATGTPLTGTYNTRRHRRGTAGGHSKTSHKHRNVFKLSPNHALSEANEPADVKPSLVFS